MNRQDVNREAAQMLGAVPGFLNAVPDEHVGPLWESMRKIQLTPGAIPAKYQQLVMLAVSTYAKCKYCTDFHTEVARALGATKEEITETALLAGHTAQWSNFLGGIQYDFDQFKREVRAACQVLSQNGQRAARAQQPQPRP
jgi:AhpD family alkylhydroperoxidase